MRVLRGLITVSIFAWIAISTAWSQTYPTKPIVLVVPFGVGGVTDLVSRLLAKELAIELGQPIIVENKAGASGMTGASIAAKSKPDGYTLLVGNISTLAINPLVYSKMPYDPKADFVSVSMLSTQPIVFLVTKKLKDHSIAQLIELSKNKPGGLNFGSGGASFEVMNAAFMDQTGARMTTVRFKGDGDAIRSLISGDIDVMLSSTSSAKSMIEGGQVHAVAVTAKERSELLPNTPTLFELGVSLEAASWQAISAPTGTPAEVIKILNAAIVKILGRPEVKRGFMQQGVSAIYSTSEDMQRYVNSEQTRWADVAKKAGLKPE